MKFEAFKNVFKKSPVIPLVVPSVTPAVVSVSGDPNTAEEKRIKKLKEECILLDRGNLEKANLLIDGIVKCASLVLNNSSELSMAIITTMLENLKELDKLLDESEFYQVQKVLHDREDHIKILEEANDDKLLNPKDKGKLTDAIINLSLWVDCNRKGYESGIKRYLLEKK